MLAAMHSSMAGLGFLVPLTTAMHTISMASQTGEV
jgi:hypothetical protein